MILGTGAGVVKVATSVMKAEAVAEEQTITALGGIATNTTSDGKVLIVDSKGNAMYGDWSETSKLTSPENALKHWIDHSAEFPQYSNAMQYVEGAQDFVNNPPVGTLIKIRPNGDTLFYDPAANVFAVKTASGAPRTMFKPTDGINYWNVQ